MSQAKIYHVAAMSENRVIGINNRLPWKYDSDMKHFKNLTSGSTIIMGRKTFESIGKPLINRKNFVVSKSMSVLSENVSYFDSIEKAIEAVTTPKGYIIGGESIYRQSMDLVDGIYLTVIYKPFRGDAYYPDIPGCFRERFREKLQDFPKIEVVTYDNTNKKM